MTAPALSIRGLRRAYGPICALDGIDLDVGNDELVVVLGPTGAGKTTLLRSIAGLDAPDAGSVHLRGEEATHWSPARRDVSLVFQNFSLYPEWTVERNLAFPLRAPARRLSDGEISERIAWASELLRIGHLLHRPAQHLSGGEMQRVAIGRAIVRRPFLFLMDEPLTNLDAKLREELRVELVVLRRELRIPMVYVTHDQSEAMSMGDRLLVLSKGRILQEGTPHAIYHYPASEAVGVQLGEPKINVIPVEQRDSHWSAPGGEQLLPVTGARPERMLMGVRPEWLRPEGGNSTGTVRLVEDTGPALVLAVDWLVGQQLIYLLVEKGGRAWKPGDKIDPDIDPERIILWPLTGQMA
ncbi:MAG: ABC transporter ATP-binding protein [Candidatus Latescibacterota bacterium]|nr:ABC transporter ATP-binding protein [Candidatus Latescibacterota bacterium]